jgi:hypothetical protein
MDRGAPWSLGNVDQPPCGHLTPFLSDETSTDN